MAQEIQTKTGGPYTKKEQEERRIQVYHLHFEKNESAAKIAEELGINRNTINEDIKFWYAKVGQKIGIENLAKEMHLHILRMKIQRDRLLEELDSCEKIEQRISLERFISELDGKLLLHYTKMAQHGFSYKETEIRDEEIREFLRELIFDESTYGQVFSERQLKIEMISRKKCSAVHAEEIISKMKRDGVYLFKSGYSIDGGGEIYTIVDFALMRGFITKEEKNEFFQRIEIRQEKIESEWQEKKKKFEAKYGANHNAWPEEAHRKFSNEEEP